MTRAVVTIGVVLAAGVFHASATASARQQAQPELVTTQQQLRWKAYVDGTLPRDEAIRRIVAELK